MALGVSYNGQPYQGWQSQLSGQTVQDKLELALGKFTTQKSAHCVPVAPIPVCTG